MWKNMKVRNSLDFFKIINAILIMNGCIGFILPFIILNKPDNAENISTSIPLTSVVGYCRFLAAGKNQMFFDIAIHNIAIAIFGFIISFFSRGILGCLILFFNLFVLGTVLFSVHNLPTVIFVLLEFIGICVAVFGGTALSEKRKREVCLRDLLKQATLLLSIISCVYVLASVIEQYVITGHWR